MKMLQHVLMAIVMLVLLVTCANEPQDYMQETQAEKDARMQWWREARFGMFIHWGLYAVPAGEWNGQRVKGIGEWIQAALNIPKEEYEKFAPQFNPVDFDAAEWVKLAKDAGMKYMVITSKHHDGFALFDSKVTQWDVVDATPYGKDILAQLKTECDRQGISFNTYYSILDWHHPAQYVDPDADNPRAGHSRNKIYEDQKADYIDYMETQLDEILTNYDVDVLWFDGEWPHWWIKEDGIALYNWLRNKKPSLIINNRVGGGRGGMSGFDEGEGYAGDFGTPEQEIPDTGRPGVDWESCMTMNDTWGYKYFDDNWKSTETLLHNLIDIVSKGGNYLLNVGPKADGTIPEESVTRLREIGAWMEKNGESIYGTSASPFEAPAWGRYTHKPGKLFVHVFERPGEQTITIPVETDQISQVYVLQNSQQTLEFTDSDGETVITLPARVPDDIASVYVVEYTGSL